MVRANEPALRAMLVHSLQQRLGGSADGLPVRQNRRTPLIEAALAPARDVRALGRATGWPRRWRW